MGVPSCRILMESVGESFGLFYVLYSCSICFAVIRVISAVFITETMKVVANDEQTAVINRERSKKVVARKIGQIFRELNRSGNGEITREEFHRLEDCMLNALVETLGVSAHDLTELFDFLDRDGNGTVSVLELTQGLRRLKGSASEVDVVLLLNTVRDMDSLIKQMNVKMDRLALDQTVFRAKS